MQNSLVNVFVPTGGPNGIGITANQRFFLFLTVESTKMHDGCSTKKFFERFASVREESGDP